MRPRRPLATAAVVLALATAPAAALAQDAEPVVGGGSFNDAPLLEPGSYRDTILGTEFLYYAIELKAGQRLRVGVEAQADEKTFQRTIDSLELVYYGPLRENPPFGFEADLAGQGDSLASAGSMEGVYPAVEPFADTVDGSQYLGPGTWYIGLYALWLREGEPLKAEIPIRLELEVLGEPAPEEPDPTVEPAGTAQAEATPAASGARRRDDDDGASSAALAGVGVGGLALGALAGALAGRRRRSV